MSPWVRLDDHFDEHPKVAALSDSALSLWVSSLAYSNRNLTDGFVPHSVGMRLRYCEGNPVPAIRELEAAQMWEQANGGWRIHDYEHYQKLREQVLEDRAETRIRVAKHRSNAVTTTDGNERVLGTGSTSTGSVSKQEDFDSFWRVYPRKAGKRAARAAFEKATERASAGAIIASAERFRDDPNREPQFTPHPATWLNQDRWDDDPLPPRGGKAKSVSNILRMAEEAEK